MLNVPDLERRWKHYRRSKRIPYIAAVLIITLASAGTFYLLFMPGITTPEAKQLPSVAHNTPQQPPLTETVSASEPVVPQNSLTAATLPETPRLSSTGEPTATSPAQEQPVFAQPTKLTPSMHFMHDFESDVMDYYFEDVTPTEKQAPVKPLPQPEPMPTPQGTPKSALPSITPQSNVPPAEEVVLNAPVSKTARPAAPAVREENEPREMLIQRDDDMKDIQDVIARFKKNKNPALSLFVAKRYYKIGNYQQAYNYALITNELDNNIEDSWLIFAKSLYKLDQKDMAIKTLKAYIQESSSVKAKITLDQMERGTF